MSMNNGQICLCYSGFKYISIRKNVRYSGHGNQMSQPEQWSSKILLFIGFNHVGGGGGVNYTDPVTIWISLPKHHAKQNRLNMSHLVTNGFISLVSRIIKLSLHSEIQTSPDFEWSKRGWFANGSDFEWDLKFRSPAQPSEILTNGHHFANSHLKSGQKCSDFKWLGP